MVLPDAFTSTQADQRVVPSIVNLLRVHPGPHRLLISSAISPTCILRHRSQVAHQS